MIESKIEKRTFGIAEFMQEEKWLEEHHKNGWCLVKTDRNKYQFERCAAAEWIYQLDFMGNSTVDEAYIQMFKDCGWEYVLQYGRWCYFRRKKEPDVDLSIFSDRLSKIEMYTRILQSRRLIVIVSIFVIACLIEWLTIFTNVFRGDNGGFIVNFLKSALPWIGCGLFVATSFSVLQYIKLKKMVKELKLPYEQQTK